MIEITNDMMIDLLGYITEIFSDLSPVILLVVGVGLGVMVITVIIKALRG